MDKKILVLVGPSGSGKSTFAHFILENYSGFEFSVSATTREIRGQEVHGKDYYYLTLEEFQEKIQNGSFLEYEEVYPDILYGSLKSEVERIIDSGNRVIFDIDILGAINIKKQFGDLAHIVMLRTENLEALKQRLIDRGTENAQDLEKRTQRFEKELALMADQADDVVINRTGDIESAKNKFREIISEHFVKE